MTPNLPEGLTQYLLMCSDGPVIALCEKFY
jgi:hypothetical protein